MKTREDWLCDQLDRDDLDAGLRAKYEKELEDYAIRHERAVTIKRQAEEREAQRRADIRARLLANDQDLVSTVGREEFGDDYEIVEEGSEFVVYSKVAREDQSHRRPHATREKADADLRYLLWNRLYSKYVRTGELDSLGELAC